MSINKNKNVMKTVTATVTFYLTVALAVFSFGILLQDTESVKATDSTFKQAEKYCIMEALWYEARGEPALGILAVASVIENRKNHEYYPDTYCGVIHQHKQFSYRLHRSIKNRESWLVGPNGKDLVDQFRNPEHGLARLVKREGDPASRMPFAGLPVSVEAIISEGLVLPYRPPKNFASNLSTPNLDPVVLIHLIAHQMVHQGFTPILEPHVLWYTTHSVRNYWTAKMSVAVKIGNHRFYQQRLLSRSRKQ